MSVLVTIERQVCVCALRAHTCLMLLIYTLLISINEIHTNHILFIISLSAFYLVQRHS